MSERDPEINAGPASAPVPAPVPAGFARDVVEGLSSRPRTLPCQWLYDERGSELFEAITRLPEYYPTRTETAILRERAHEIAAVVGEGAALLEYGAGAGTKTRILLDAAPTLAAYLPVDVSEDFLRYTVEALRADYPALAVHPVVGDFTSPLDLPQDLSVEDLSVDLPDLGATRLVGFFPGSTVGNLSDPDIVTLLRRAREATELFILGYDLVKAESVLVAAYDDAQGLTAAFNLNLLARINRELGADFDLQAFTHRALWNAAQSRIEMHLVSATAQTATVAGHAFHFGRGDTIHTENSRKFTPSAVAALAERAGWRVGTTWFDTPTAQGAQFAVAVLHPSQPARPARPG